MSLRDTTILILAGGQGTRLRSKVAHVPKPLAPVHQRPFISFLLDRLIACQPARIVLCTGYMAEKFHEQIGSSYQGFAMDYSVETQALGTGGALAQALNRVNTHQVMICNGDSYCDADLAEFEDWHLQKPAHISLVLVSVPDTSRYGRVELDEQECICRFLEKQPDQGQGLINAGIYLTTAPVLAKIPRDTPTSLERDIFPTYVEQGLYGYPSRADFIDIGTPESYDYAEKFFQV